MEERLRALLHDCLERESALMDRMYAEEKAEPDWNRRRFIREGYYPHLHLMRRNRESIMDKLVEVALATYESPIIVLHPHTPGDVERILGFVP